MNFRYYMKSRFLLLVGQFLFLFLASLYFYSLGINFSQLAFVALAYGALVIAYYIMDYQRKKKYFRHIARGLEAMDEKYLLPEVFEEPDTYEESAYMAIMREMGNAMAQKLLTLDAQNRDYREFIEAWVHEIKQPLASIQLLAHGGDGAGRIQARVEEINLLTEKVLYYARSESLSTDLTVHPASLRSILVKAIEENKYMLRLSGFNINLFEDDVQIYTDEKSLLFVISQLLRNAITYRRADGPSLNLCHDRQGDQVLLKISDNGIGIPPEDLPRVFDKGFTGQNGRRNRRSTGIGMYLCKKFCDHMQTQIAISSEPGEHTTVTLLLPAVISS